MDRHQSLLKHLATIASPEIATTYLKKYESTPWYLRDKVTNNYWYRYSGRIAQYEQQIATMAPGTEVRVTIENKPTRRGLRPQKIVKLEKVWTPPPPLVGAHILHYYMYPENYQKGTIRMIPSITNRGLPAQGEQAEKVDLILKARARSDQKYKLVLSSRAYTEGSDFDPISPNAVIS